ncbi:MAG: MFS transporter [Deltaproteobacteria bacterium]|nr:MFS transporter [Deltaproteobacteria bacterium]
MSSQPKSEIPGDTSRARTFIVLMGVVAMFGDMTYEGARGLVGPYLALLGASATAVGFAVGFGEFLGYGLRLFSGWLGDRTRAYWPLVIFGYSINFLAVPGLALVGSWEGAIALILLERIGKAVRSPSRSTLVSFAASQAGMGKSFGLEEALDQIGAVSGPLLTALVIWVLRAEPIEERYRAAFLVLLLPVFLNVGLVLLARRRFPTPESFEAEERPSSHLGSLFGWYVVASMLVGLGFADWALLAYHAARTSLFQLSMLPILYAGAMAVDAVAALLLGHLFDRVGLVALAIGVFASALAAPLVFLHPTSFGLVLGAVVWSVGLGAQDSVFKAALAALVPKAQRARAYGSFYALFGLAWWVGSTLMGWLYDRSVLGLVVFSSTTQLLAVPIFLILARRLQRAAP